MNRARRLLGSVGLALATIAATLLLLEIGVRIALGLDPNTFESLDSHRPEAARRQFRLIDLIRPSADDLVAYELRPGLRGRFRRQEIEINSLGMRGPERTLEKPEEGVFRIAALGDSHLFGWGVSYEHTFLALLEARLAERFPSRSFEALNLGVPGYNTVMEVQAFSRRVDLIDPDLLLIEYTGNDAELPNFLYHRHVLSLKESYLAGLVRRRLALLKGESLPQMGLLWVTREESREWFPEGRIPERFRPLYGWDNMIAAYRRLADLAKERGIPVVMLLDRDYFEERLEGRTDDLLSRPERDLVDLCGDLGFQVVETQDRLTDYLRKRGLTSEALWINERDSHPNPIHHRIIADVLFERLAASDILPPDETALTPESRWEQ